MLIGDRILADRVVFSRSLSTLDSFLLPQLEIRRGTIIAFRSPPEIRTPATTPSSTTSSASSACPGSSSGWRTT